MKHIAVIGLGKFGASLARELMAQGVQVIAVDRDRDAVEAIKESVTYAAALNSTDEAALRGVGIPEVDAAVVCIGDDVEANLLTSILLKRIGVSRIWARAISPLQQEILQSLDIESIIRLEEDMGRMVARSLVTAGLAKHIPVGTGYTLAEVVVPERFVGKTLKDIGVRRNYGINVVAIRRPTPAVNDLGQRAPDEMVENVPEPDLEFEEGDILVLTGPEEGVRRFTERAAT